MNFEELSKLVLDWARDKDLLHSKNANKQFLKFIEEVFEFKTEMDGVLSFDDLEIENRLLDNFLNRMVLEMGDIFVTLIILCKQLGIGPEECLKRAYEKISKRKGKTINGTFVKEEDL